MINDNLLTSIFGQTNAFEGGATEKTSATVEARLEDARIVGGRPVGEAIHFADIQNLNDNWTQLDHNQRLNLTFFMNMKIGLSCVCIYVFNATFNATLEAYSR